MGWASLSPRGFLAVLAKSLVDSRLFRKGQVTDEGWRRSCQFIQRLIKYLGSFLCVSKTTPCRTEERIPTINVVVGPDLANKDAEMARDDRDKGRMAHRDKKRMAPLSLVRNAFGDHV